MCPKILPNIQNNQESQTNVLIQEMRFAFLYLPVSISQQSQTFNFLYDQLFDYGRNYGDIQSPQTLPLQVQ